jgi:predicted acetyltransferase
MALTAPGPLDGLTRVPMSGLSWVSVHPDHRRRGVLREMITHYFSRLHEQGAALSGLHAAEVPIYGRFGYGISSVEQQLKLDRGAAFGAPSLDDAASGSPPDSSQPTPTRAPGSSRRSTYAAQKPRWAR